MTAKWMFAQLNTYRAKFAYFLEKLKGIPDGDGTLLDHSLVLYGSSLSDGNQHNFSPLPIVLAGGASGRLAGGRHLQFPKDTRMSNLLLADKVAAHRHVRRQHRRGHDLTMTRRMPLVAALCAALMGAGAGLSPPLARCRSTTRSRHLDIVVPDKQRRGSMRGSSGPSCISSRARCAPHRRAR
jgi:hypothetical protein